MTRDVSVWADPIGLTHIDPDVVEAAKDTETTEAVFRPVWPEIDGSGFAGDPIVEPLDPTFEFVCRDCFLIKLKCQHVGDGFCVDCVDVAVFG